MKTPFTIEQFFSVFTQYNNAIWPAQWLFAALAICAVYLIARRHRRRSRFVLLLLTILWLWTGFVYHGMFFSAINPAAYIFGAFCVIQAVLFGILAFAKTPVDVRYNGGYDSLAGMGLILYALVIYPLLGVVLGHTYPAAPTFGAPCPTTIFTLGILLLMPTLPWWILIVPGLWAVIGFNAALTFSVYEDYGLLLSGILAIGLMFITRRKISLLAD